MEYSTLDLFEQAGAELEVVALTAGRNLDLLVAQALEWRPQIAVIEDASRLGELRDRLAGAGSRLPPDPQPWSRRPGAKPSG